VAQGLGLSTALELLALSGVLLVAAAVERPVMAEVAARLGELAGRVREERRLAAATGGGGSSRQLSMMA